jgi:prephenate dehydrogenase
MSKRIQKSLVEFAREEIRSEKRELIAKIKRLDKALAEIDRALAKKDENSVLALYEIGEKPIEIAKKLGLPKVKVSNILKTVKFSK